LPDRESRAVLRRVILPTAAASAAPQARPVVVFVGGQPGAGKTNAADLVQAALGRRGGSVRIGRDLYKAAHCHYAAALAADVRTFAPAVRTSARRSGRTPASGRQPSRSTSVTTAWTRSSNPPSPTPMTSVRRRRRTAVPGTGSRSSRSRRRRPR
ncbi:hypothetical protein EAO77_36750, partial [Streptomyces sp. t39]